MKAMLPASAAPPAHRPIRSNDDRRRARTVSAIKDAGEIGVGDAIGTAEIAAFPEPAIFDRAAIAAAARSEEHTSELQSLMRISYAVFSLKKKKRNEKNQTISRKQ